MQKKKNAHNKRTLHTHAATHTHIRVQRHQLPEKLDSNYFIFTFDSFILLLYPFFFHFVIALLNTNNYFLRNQVPRYNTSLVWM